ncbi:RNA-binding protein 12B-like [Arapaima gigas]
MRPPHSSLQKPRDANNRRAPFALARAALRGRARSEKRRKLTMAVVVRLQGLHIKAGTGDIREFFSGLYIPEGGVHIIGGDLGEAFIIFTKHNDGQLALQRSGAVLRGSHVVLSLSSKAELQQKMASCLKKIEPLKTGRKRKHPDPPDAAVALLLSLVSAVNTLQKKNVVSPKHPPSLENCGKSFSVSGSTNAVPAAPQEATFPAPCLNTRYLSLHGLPRSITKREICSFFEGLEVKEVIVNIKSDQGYICLVKFARERDASEGLKYDGRNMGPFCVEVSEATEEAWFSAVDVCRKSSVAHAVRSRSGSPKKHSSDCASTSSEQCHCIMVQNLPRRTIKTEIKQLFGCGDIPNDQVLHLLDKEGNRTDTAFIIFDRKEDFASAIKLDGCSFFSRTLSVSPVAKEKMLAMTRRRTAPLVRGFNSYRADSQREETYLYMRNLPSDIRKIEIKDFFRKFGIADERITLLRDERGTFIGEAIVRFPSQHAAKIAERRSGRCFLGVRVLLSCINLQQVEDLLHRRR